MPQLVFDRLYLLNYHLQTVEFTINLSLQMGRQRPSIAGFALARLYRSTGRHADAQAAIGPVLEGFAPTPELPEIAAALAFVGDIEARAQL
jgi:hypothetical protein